MRIDTLGDFGEIDCGTGVSIVNQGEAIDLGSPGGEGLLDTPHLAGNRQKAVHWHVTETFNSAGSPTLTFGLVFAAGPLVTSGAGLVNYTPQLTAGPGVTHFLSGGAASPLELGVDFYTPWPFVNDLFSVGNNPATEFDGRYRYVVAACFDLSTADKTAGKIEAAIVVVPSNNIPHAKSPRIHG